MKTIIALIFILFSITTYSQKDTTYFFGVNGRIGSENGYEFKKEINYLSGNKIKVETYKIDQNRGKSMVTEDYKKVDDNTYQIKYKEGDFAETIIRKYIPQENGIFKFTDLLNNKIRRTGFTELEIPLILHGVVTEYYNNGNKLSESVFENNELISNKNWQEDGTEYIDNIFYSVDKVPLFTTGAWYLNQHILKTFKDSQIDISKISGKIIIGFVVSENGRTGGFKVVRGISKRLDEIALKAFDSLLGEWTPASLNGKPVKYFQLFPINFIFNESKIDYVDFDGSSIHWQTN